MPRIPYAPADLAAPREIVDAIRARRGGTLINLDRMLLHSPEMAMGWNTYLGAIRTRLQLSPKLRELAMCVVAGLNGADYERGQHARECLKAGGTTAQLDALPDPQRAQADGALFDDTERAALAVAVEMTRSVQVSDASFDALARELDARALVEFVG